MLLWAGIYPFSRFLLLTAFDYNEGWNVYNAQKVAEHQLLYPPHPAWTIVNYPALSFHVIAAFSSFTSDYLVTGRIVSLVSLCLMGLLAGLIVWQLTRAKLSSILTAAFVIALFCACATNIVGMDDPQMLAQVFFLAGLYVYLRGERSGFALELTALLFVLGGNIKHNLLEFPLAVLLDLLYAAPRKAFRFALACLGLAAISVLLTSYFEGRAYLSCLLIPRAYSIHNVLEGTGAAILSTLLPSIAALWMVRYCWKNPAQRILVFFLFCAVAVDAIFSGGEGVDINIFFGYMLAVALLTAVFWAELPGLPARLSIFRNSAAVCSLFFLLLAMDIIRNQNISPLKRLRDDKISAQRFAIETAFIRQQPGPAICENLLLCFYAGKPYLYDPFNAHLYMESHRLDPQVISDELKDRRWGAVQLLGAPEQIGSNDSDYLLTPAIVTALRENYRPGLINEDGIIYVPK